MRNEIRKMKNISIRKTAIKKDGSKEGQGAYMKERGMDKKKNKGGKK